MLTQILATNIQSYKQTNSPPHKWMFLKKISLTQYVVLGKFNRLSFHLFVGLKKKRKNKNESINL